jgi:ribulose-bisphosphate carboxylase large chain
MIFPHTNLDLSGDRIVICYRLTANDESEAWEKAKGVCLEQTVEAPLDLLANDDIRANIVGRIESLKPVARNRFETHISYAVETAGSELTQLLNVIFGNSSMQPGIRVQQLHFPESLLRVFKGPRYGLLGIRKLLGVERRPLLCTALKPMGLSTGSLADLALQIALGGIDIIKDDHGLANQIFAPFKERLQSCADAVNEANQRSGYHCIYVPNITGPASQIIPRALMAMEAGAGGVMLAPGLIGFDVIRQLAADNFFNLPIFSHPAWSGSYAVHPDNGIAHRVIFGQLPRLAGADATIFVNYGGRFSFSPQDCRGIVEGASMPMGHIRPIFPTPGGGMTLAKLPEMLDFYGDDVILLIAGGLYAHGPDLGGNCRQFRQYVEQI